MAEYEAGRELDKLIAEKVLEIPAYLIHTDDNGKYIDMPNGFCSHIASVAYYSTSITAAWDVVVMVSEESRWYELAWRPAGAVANFTGDPHHNAYATFDECGNSRSRAQALAICRAAIKAKEWMTETTTTERGS